MMEHWFFLCAHLVFVIDRIEPPYVVVEWADSGSFTDIEQRLLPRHAAEGDSWMVHLRPHRPRLASTNTSQHEFSSSFWPDWLPTQDVPSTQPFYRYRFSRLSFQ